MIDTKDRILDALELVLTESGPGAATLEAVAARAGVSKGGLLYHFGGKEALFNGLLDRLRDLGAQDAATHDDCDALTAYLATSSRAEDAYTRTLLATMRLIGTPGVDAENAIADSLDHWADVLAEHITDPMLLRLVMLVGDGLYLRALLGAQRRPLDDNLVSYVRGLAAR
ncbi:TetR/AcrR family transcriptional regulator [Mobilicoccus pelagius]|uniref:Putative TetR family transcriptional regulator n=1 Tax=Mobilicoccus pelagius NBRC 104925 TaxID=1089455 RepID=H5UPQ0_9MICO|nr:TetR/AcrR family transcriptional regulator [Mobilicoccus pelagius]GAB47708.1 putative TetR family transcriptional regulator [Mobilicoccus pelagius NBRC 104925]